MDLEPYSKSCTGIILTGGLNTRMNGINKSFLKIGDQYYIDRIAEIISRHLAKCMVVCRDSRPYQNMPLPIVKDILKDRSPLTGIHAGLVAMHSQYAFCISCDLPLLHAGVVGLLLESIEDGFDVIVPASGTYFQPLCAVYSKRCAPVIEAQLEKGDMKVDHLYQNLKIKKISYNIIRKVDPDLLSFFNVNTADEVEKAEQLYKHKNS